jgi:hypothetical protein
VTLPLPKLTATIASGWLATGTAKVIKIMMTRSAHPRRHGAPAMTWLLAASLSPAAMTVALAQTAQAPSGAVPAPAAPAQTAPQAQAPAAQAGAPVSQPRGLFPAQPPPAGQPGFVYEFGRWWDAHTGAIGAEATQDALKQAAQATKEAATALIRIPTGRFIEVHQRCALAPNGAPDCRSAAASVCRTKGFQDGNPINVQSSQNCPPAVWMSGREPAAGQCPQETVVLMVACR